MRVDHERHSNIIVNLVPSVPLGYLFDMDLDISNLRGHPMANLSLPEQTNTSINEFLDAMQIGLLFALATDHECVNTVLNVVGQLPKSLG